MEASVAAKRERENSSDADSGGLVPIGKTGKLLLNESNQHRILSTGGAGSLEEQRAVYWMHARWGKEMPVKWERTKVLQRFAFGIQTCSSSMRYYRVKPERQSGSVVPLAMFGITT